MKKELTQIEKDIITNVNNLINAVMQNVITMIATNKGLTSLDPKAMYRLSEDLSTIELLENADQPIVASEK